MERRQVDLLLKVLRILQQEGILDHLILIGSWVFYFYKFYFHKRKPIIASLRTRDVDFLVPSPSSINKKINLPDLLKKLGFVVDFRGEQGYMRLVSPYFFIEFLVPERGRPTDKPYPLPLGINAQRLRFLDILSLKTIKLEVKDLKLTLPHPVCFLLHKIIVFERRKRSKKEKEIEQIKRLIRFLTEEGELVALKQVYLKIHPKWKKKVLNNLIHLNEYDVVDILSED